MFAVPGYGTVTVLLILFMNLAVGLSIGLTGIAGFLLPMFYAGFLGMGAAPALALSFSAFLVSGVLGSVNFFRTGNLRLREALLLSAGSIFGALFGVRINLLIPERTMQVILYLVVLFSGLSILFREFRSARGRSGKGGSAAAGTAGSGSAAAGSAAAGSAAAGNAENGSAGRQAGQGARYVILGFVTGAVCAASGAGGPVLVMPLLTLIGFPAHTAIGMSLFDSIFIALPAAAGYLLHAAGDPALKLLVPVLAAHGIGVWFGSLLSPKVDQSLLKRIVAALSVGVALWKLFG